MASHTRTVAYLREVAGQYINHEADEAVLRHVQHSYRTGSELGLRSEGAHAQWALIMVLTQGRIVRYEPVREFISKRSYGPDQQMNELVRLTIEALQQQRSRLGGSA